MLSGELVKDLVLVQCRPKEIIEYIRKLESQIAENQANMGKVSDRLDKLLELSQPTKIPDIGIWDWDTYTTSGSSLSNDLLKYNISAS